MRFLRRSGLFAMAIGSTVLSLPAADVAPGAKKESLIDPPEVALRKFSVAPGLKVDTFAAEPDVRNPVAISVDAHGRVFVVESDRRRSSVFDIRGHKDWLEADLSFRTVSERADFLKQQVSPTNAAVIKRLTGGGRGTFEDFNKDGAIDWRDLEVQTERIRLLQDTDGDGHADRVSVFADGFTNIVAGVAAGVLAHRDAVYFACIPDLWKLPADSSSALPQRTKLLSGFGVHIAFGGHDMHGLIMGPDGRLYWSIADRGTDTNLFARIKNPLPGLTPELLADSGCVFRAYPDGSDFEVIAWGLRNPQELAFDEFGNLFTADNNGDGGDKARWHYVVEGADFGWRIGWQWLEARAYQPKMGPWNGERLWHLAESNTAAYLLPPLAHIGHGPAGLVYNPGTGLPREFDRHFFLCDFPGHVLMWTNIPDGASFKVGPIKNFFGDLGPTDVAFHPDGGVLVSDWFKSFDKSDKGRLYRIHDPATDASEAVRETRRLLVEGVAKLGVEARAELLGHADMRVRLGAQWALASMTNFPVLSRVAMDSRRTLRARIHAIWALEQAIREIRMGPRQRNNVDYRAEMNSLVSLLKDRELEVRAQACKLMASALCGDAQKPLRELFHDSEPRVQAFALRAYTRLFQQRAYVAATVTQPLATRAHIAIRDVVKGSWGVAEQGFDYPGDELRQLLERSRGGPYVLHEGVNLFAELVKLLPASSLKELFQSERSQVRNVRLAELLTLRRLANPDIAHFLSDPDSQLALEAARAINDVPIEAAYPQLAALLPSAQAELRNPQSEITFFTFRRALNANFRLGDATNAQALVAFAARGDLPEPLRIEALELLGDWARPPARDHVMGLYRPLPSRDGKVAAEALSPAVASLLTNAPQEVRLAAIKTVAALGLKEVDLFTVVADRQQATEVRVEALRFLARINDWRYVGALNLALGDSSEPLRIAATRLQGGSSTAQLAKVLEGGSIAEKQSALAALASIKSVDADALLAGQVEALLKETLAKELVLDVLEVASNRPWLKSKLDAYQSRFPKGDPLAAYRPVLFGGNAENGRKLFIENQQIACFRCHKIHGEGGEVGPELAGVGTRKGRDYLLESILYPNKQIAADYENLLVTLKNGTIYAGQVKQATDKELLLNSPEDGLVKVATADIKERQRGLSAMPEELVTYLSKRELRDLVEFLATLK